MANSNIPEIIQFHKRISTTAEELISKDFPSKVAELDERSRSPKWSLDRLDEIHAQAKSTALYSHKSNEDAPPAKRAKVSADGDSNKDEIVVNAPLIEMIDEIKPEISTLMERCATVRIWITLLIPKIEDGNNFGVGVQEDALAELRQVEAECATYLDQISRYFLTRGKMISKVLKYPQISDYKRCVQELDSKQFVSLRFMLSEIRNHHCTLADLINKNIEKIKKPRSQNHAPMY